MTSDLDASRTFWDREHEARSHTSWLEHPAISLYALWQIDPVNAEWPLDWFMIWLRGRRFRRGLSIGCGSGAFERDVVQHGLCREVDAFDASFQSIRAARAQANAAGLRYYVADFNRCALPRRKYDIVFFHQSLHHVSALEPLLAEVLQALRPGGLLYLDEYIGPSRTSWSDERIEEHRRVYAALPDEVKATPALPLPIQADDPSEAIRSDEIVGAVDVGFRTLAFRGYGGNILSVIYPNLKATPDEVVNTLIEADRVKLAKDGMPYYAVIVARPRRFMARRRALRIYRLSPGVART